jgi:hypothetical protein
MTPPMPVPAARIVQMGALAVTRTVAARRQQRKHEMVMFDGSRID